MRLSLTPRQVRLISLLHFARKEVLPTSSRKNEEPPAATGGFFQSGISSNNNELLERIPAVDSACNALLLRAFSWLPASAEHVPEPIPRTTWQPAAAVHPSARSGAELPLDPSP